MSDLFKSITSLPSDATLVSLPAGPLLELVCLAAQRQLTAAWLSLAAILFAQLNPPVFSLITKSGPTQEAQMYVERLLPVLLQCGLGSLSMDGAMDAVGLFFIVSFQLMFISFGIESRYCTRIFLVHGQGESFQFIVIIDIFFLIVFALIGCARFYQRVLYFASRFT